MGGKVRITPHTKFFSKNSKIPHNKAFSKNPRNQKFPWECTEVIDRGKRFENEHGGSQLNSLSEVPVGVSPLHHPDTQALPFRAGVCSGVDL